MSNSHAVAVHLPYLRRYARALTGSQQSGDAYVVATLEAIVADPAILSSDAGPRVALFRDFSKILNSVKINSDVDAAEPVPAAERNLAAMTLRARQAFLLMAVEEFTTREAAQILDTTDIEVRSLIDQAGREIAGQVATSVVIIEDEPLIAMDLERLVQDLGHTVCGIARTHKQAVAAVEAHRPGLVLADIQLADGSSGLDAVNEILTGFKVPVIFVTAYPERLLTGERPEPTFLISKPFHAETLKAVISQALFFDVSAGRTAAGSARS